MDNIKNREFIRTLNGMIAKVLDVDPDDYHSMVEIDKSYLIDSINGMEWTEYVDKKDIIKHDLDIMKILVTYDFAILEYYVSKYRKRIRRVFQITKIGNQLSFENPHCSFLYDLSKKWLDGRGYNPKLISIVTVEDFFSNEYEVN